MLFRFINVQDYSENDRVSRVDRGLYGYKIQTLNPQAMAEDLSFKKTGTHPFKRGVINLANGRMVMIAINQESS
jgi:hypothetical protein